MNTIHEAYKLGQSFWLDYIRRDLLTTGELQGMVNAGEIRGVTSNPTIFDQAIAGSDLYTPFLRRLAHAGQSAEAALDALIIEDIRSATDIFLPLYEAANGTDGFVSIEVNPQLAKDTEGTIREAQRLWDQVNRPNVMVKIPATEEGIPAIEHSIYKGLNINITLIFSLDRYAQVIEAYLSGLERRLEEGESLAHISSVASFFVSRVDTAADGRLEEVVRQEGSNAPRAAALMGKIAVANAKMAYAQFKAAFESDRFNRLREQGAQLQRPLWASTSTKNPTYSDTLYVDELIGPHTVNTLPPKTIDAFRHHGSPELTLEDGLSEARGQIAALEALNISMDEITAQLEREGVASFSKSFESLLSTVDARRQALVQELGAVASEAARIFEGLNADQISMRVWQRDTDLWPGDPGFIREQLGWLTFPQSKRQVSDESAQFAAEVRGDNLETALLITPAGAGDALQLLPPAGSDAAVNKVLVQDAIGVEQMRSIARKTPAASTLFIVSDDTGESHQVLTVVDQHWSRATNRLKDKARERFVALVPEGSALSRSSQQREFRKIWLEKEPIGGEYAALSRKILLPAALLGSDPGQVLEAASDMAHACRAEVSDVRNPGVYLGGMLSLMVQGRLLILADPELRPIAEWVKRLLHRHLSGVQAEIAQDEHVLEELEGDGWSAIYLRRQGSLHERLQQRQIMCLILEDAEHIGAEIFRWQFGVAVAAHLIGENPFRVIQGRQFDRRVRKLAEFAVQKGRIPFPKSRYDHDGLSLWAAPSSLDPDSRDQMIRELKGKFRLSREVVISPYRLAGRKLDRSMQNLERQRLIVSHRANQKLRLILTLNELKLSSLSDPLETGEAVTALAEAEHYTERGWEVFGISFDTSDLAASFLEDLAQADA